MNAFDYFFENTSHLDKDFLVGKETITYKDLHSTCIDLAAWIEKEVGQNKHILLLSVNNLFLLKVYLAVIKSGNIIIPLDPNIENENYRYISNLTNPELIFLTRDVEKRLSVNPDKSIFPDTPMATGNRLPIAIGTASGTKRPELSPLTTHHSQLTTHNSLLTTPHSQLTTHHSPLNPELFPFDKERCAEIIFTSGSTGKPKGVMITHKNLKANTETIISYLKLSLDDRMLVVLPFYYCYGLSLLHTHLRIGGSIVLNNSFMFLGTVINNLLDYRCTGFAGVPSHFQIILRMSDSFKKTKFPDLRYVTQAGGKLAPVFIDEFRKSFTDILFYVMYGQTEATARLSYLPPDLYEKKKGSIGRGIPGVELKVVNEKGETVKPGELGEVVACGDNIMMGYFADNQGTRNAIRNGWLYTGDLGTVDDDGFIFLTARKSEIIKVGGKRVSPKEIEDVILRIPEVVDCSVEGVEDKLQGEALRATVVLRKGTMNNINEETIKQHCSKHLALFKIPKIYEIKDQIIISPTGKKIKN
ncbi:MAG: AMP-binding protein [Bacteroidales bacterium]|nr:AMP-binding protein [Bacteroidales bacterium]